MRKQQHLLFTVLRIIFWLNAALIIRFLGAAAFSERNPNLPMLYVAAIPLTLVSVYITKLISGRQFAQLLQPVVIMTFVATFCDGIALAWFRNLYSQSFEVALHGAAWILWGAGWGLLFAYYFEQKAQSAPAGQLK